MKCFWGFRPAARGGRRTAPSSVAAYAATSSPQEGEGFSGGWKPSLRGPLQSLRRGAHCVPAVFHERPWSLRRGGASPARFHPKDARKGFRPAGQNPSGTGTGVERPLIRHGICRDTFPPVGGRLFGRLEAAPTGSPSVFA